MNATKGLRHFLSRQKLWNLLAVSIIAPKLSMTVCVRLPVVYAEPVIAVNDISYFGIKSPFNKVFQEQPLRLHFYKQGTHIVYYYYSGKFPFFFLSGNKSTPENFF